MFVKHLKSQLIDILLLRQLAIHLPGPEPLVELKLVARVHLLIKLGSLKLVLRFLRNITDFHIDFDLAVA